MPDSVTPEVMPSSPRTAHLTSYPKGHIEGNMQRQDPQEVNSIFPRDSSEQQMVRSPGAHYPENAWDALRRVSYSPGNIAALGKSKHCKEHHEAPHPRLRVATTPASAHPHSLYGEMGLPLAGCPDFRVNP